MPKEISKVNQAKTLRVYCGRTPTLSTASAIGRTHPGLAGRTCCRLPIKCPKEIPDSQRAKIRLNEAHSAGDCVLNCTAKDIKQRVHLY